MFHRSNILVNWFFQPYGVLRSINCPAVFYLIDLYTVWHLEITGEAGLNEGDYSEKFSVNPPNAVLAAYKKMGDAACAGEVALNLPMVKDRIDVSKLRRLAISNELPHLPWALKGELVTVHFPHRFSS